MKRQRISNHRIISKNDPNYCDEAAAIIKEGGLVAIPTETYYGIAADPFNEVALKKLYEVKQRPFYKPVLVLIHRLDQLQLLVTEVPDQYQALIKTYWPGPLTLVFHAIPGISSILTGGSGTIGIRFSSSKIASAICSASNRPITATSANISGMVPASCAGDIEDYFGDKIDLIVDGGRSLETKGSTIVRCHRGKLEVIREGQISL